MNAEMKKVRHDKRLVIGYEGERWIVDAAEWTDGTRSELRIYRIEGNITTPLLREALQLEADARGLAMITTTTDRPNRGDTT